MLFLITKLGMDSLLIINVWKILIYCVSYVESWLFTKEGCADGASSLILVTD